MTRNQAVIAGTVSAVLGMSATFFGQPMRGIVTVLSAVAVPVALLALALQTRGRPLAEGSIGLVLAVVLGEWCALALAALAVGVQLTVVVACVALLGVNLVPALMLMLPVWQGSAVPLPQSHALDG